MNIEEFLKNNFGGMEREVIDFLFKIANAKADSLCSTNNARRKFREEYANDPEKLAMFDALCERYDLNTVIVQTLGNVKAMLNNFDENNFSMTNTLDNLKLHRNIAMLFSISIQSISERLSKIERVEDQIKNDNRDGNSSGPGSGSDT